VIDYKPDTIIVLTPHGLRVRGNICIYVSENCTGSLSDNGNTVYADFKCDVPLAEKIYAKAKKKDIQIVAVNYGTASGEYSNIELDIVVYLYNRRGSEGQTGHSEIGVNRSYESAGIPSSFVADIVPVVKVY
jgi:hypothetical protein